MDIDYLLALQNARESLPGFVEKLFLYLSFIGDGPVLVAIVLVVYWCIDKRAGQFAMACFCAGNYVCQLMKNVFCVYRPWIADARITPPADAFEGAGGYSFPSGHTNGVGTALGGLAWVWRKKHRVVVALCIVVILLMGFSRNFLGVHTPQDVLVGLLVALVAIAFTNVFFNWLDRYDAVMPGHRKDVMVVVIVYIVSIASVAFILLKPYPLDYVEGVLLVDPVSMQKGSMESAGVFMGVALGWLLERRFVGFATGTELTTRDRIVRGVIGVGIVGIVYVATDLLFKAILPYNWAKLFAMFVLTFFALFIAPLAFEAVRKRQSRAQDAD